MRTFLYKILTSKEFEKYCREERGWEIIGTVYSTGNERVKIARGGLSTILLYDSRNTYSSTGRDVQSVHVGGITIYMKTLYRYDGNPHRPWAIEVEEQTGRSYSCKHETFDDLAKKIQKAWRRKRAALKLQRWWKSIYYEPGKGPGYYLAFSSFISDREMSTCQNLQIN